MQNLGSTEKTSTFGLDGNLAALLCYILTPCCFLGSILSIIFLVTEKSNSFVRFHAAQALTIFVFNIIVAIVFGGLSGGLIASGNEGLGGMVLLLNYLVGFIILAALIYAGVMAYQGKLVKLPVVGDIAARFSGN